MTITKKLGALTLLSTLSLAAHAGNFDYNYGQVGFEMGDFGGLTLTGSFEINKDMFVIARYAALSNDDAGFDIDYTDISVGAGYHMPINSKTDAVYTASFNSGEVDIPSFTILGFTFPASTDDDTGLLLTAGVRHNLNANVELAGNIYHITTFDGDTGFQGEARYNINNKMSAGLSFATGDYLDGLGLNFRMGF